mgnify:CR=1 FL=1
MAQVTIGVGFIAGANDVAEALQNGPTIAIGRFAAGSALIVFASVSAPAAPHGSVVFGAIASSA